MKLWILKPKDLTVPPWELWFDKVYGFVVRANTQEEARSIASIPENMGDEKYTHPKAWLDTELSTCEELTTDGEAGLILRDHRGA